MTTTYRLDNTQPGMWTDMPEARPRRRMRPAGNSTELVTVTITDEGACTVYTLGPEPEVDEYAGTKYKDVRDEGLARWAKRDEMKPKPKKGK